MGGYLSQLERESHPEDHVLQASCGPVRGNVYTHGDKIVDGYLGIPYAKPVVRFQKAELAEPWVETRDCTKYGPVAPPSGSVAEKFPAESRRPDDEANCLNLNVFTPRWESNEFNATGRPVMVYIHGGAFECASSADYDDYSLSGTLPLKDVVVVTINYRLGVLGFLTTGDERCLGNFGLWDQTLALKWVQKHIRSFGGNPDNVTVLGQSAGGASTDFLSLSPHSRNLFHKMIPMSGSALCDFAIRTQKDEASIFEEFARHKGFKGQGSDAFLDWYLQQPYNSFFESNGFVKSLSGNFHFIPNLDGDFFPEPLEKLRLSAPKIPVMTGVCEYEGLLFAFSDPSATNTREEMKKHIANIINETDSENAAEVQKLFYDYYTKDVAENDDEAMKKRLVELVGDYMFNIGVFDTARSSAKLGRDVFFYTFEFCNPDGFGMFANVFPFLAATHCKEIRYILGEGLFSKFEPNDADLKMIEKMTTIFSNFAKYGNPGVADWQKYDPTNGGEHYRITGDETGNESGMVDEYHGGRWKFLDQIREKIGHRQEIINGI